MKKILYVDDDKKSRHLFELAVAEVGDCTEFNLTCIHTSIEAVRQVEYQALDYVFLDYAMPVDGVDLMKTIAPYVKNSAVYFLTAFPLDFIKSRIEKEGINVSGVIPKDPKLEESLRKILKGE